MLLCYQCLNLSKPQDQCEHCGADLPGRKAPPRLQVKTALLNQLSLEYRSRDIDRAQLEARLDQEERTIRSILGQAQDDQFDDDSRGYVEEELRIGRAGLTAYLEAINTMRHWIDTQDRGELKQFLALAAQADSYMNDAVALNFNNYKTYLESMGEFLHQAGYQGPR